MAMRGALRVMGVLVFVTAFALTAAVQVQFPLCFGDYAGHWGLKARTIFFSDEMTRVFEVDPAGEFSHPEYPLAWPALLAGVSWVARRYDEYLLAFLRPALTLAVAALVAQRTAAPSALRLLAATTVCLLPYFQNPVFAGYAEALLLVFLLAGLALLENPSGASISRLAGVFCLALAAMTKNEGALAALVVSGAFCWAGKRREALLSAGVPFAAVGAWTLVKSQHLDTRPLVDFSAGAFSISKLLLAGKEIVMGQLMPELPWLAGSAAVLALSSSVVIRRRVSLLAAGAYTLILSGSYAFTRLDPAWHVQNSWDRLVLVPLVAVLVPTLFESFWEALRPFLARVPEGSSKSDLGQPGSAS
jgi:hypothetical protein